ncbi:uncharacterized protein MELLADRAFT_124258 [Melampsora larici-populina 98AG31]|uniref:Secreted protein n=1 Tax=Melampsora larici-populina (strain 98AG31 / pathotype 3-4-7) TaxID=747676 RepID=F4R7P5_MELLP|nr:uncharacterized protein MELLADRAFT_124258 [Melampsora larici-populina 98AG31]EGG11748.1 secreted protein [Melampsora larici-populina 98AG31]
MIGIQLRKMVLLSLILSISIIPMMCEMVEEAEDIAGFSRVSKSRSSLEEDEDSWRSSEGSQCAAQSCTFHPTCSRKGCGDCGGMGYCLESGQKNP